MVPCRTSKQKKVVILTFDTNFRTHRNLILLACPVLWNWSKVKRQAKKIDDLFAELKAMHVINTDSLGLLTSNLSEGSKLLELQQ